MPRLLILTTVLVAFAVNWGMGSPHGASAGSSDVRTYSDGTGFPPPPRP